MSDTYQAAERPMILLQSGVPQLAATVSHSQPHGLGKLAWIGQPGMERSIGRRRHRKQCRLTGELKHSVQAGSVLGARLCKASGSLQVCLHLVLYLQLAHASARLQVMEVNQLIWLRLRL